VPLAARTPAQRSLAAAQDALPAKLLMVAGSAALLPLFWAIDTHAALAGPFSPLEAGNRLVSLLLAIPVLALLLWQWQQLVQTLWLFSRTPAALAGMTPLPAERLASERVSLGIPLLLLQPLILEAPPASPEASSANESQGSDGSAGGDAVAVEPEQGAAGEQGGDLDQQVG
jgi:hypothetical protein